MGPKEGRNSGSWQNSGSGQNHDVGWGSSWGDGWGSSWGGQNQSSSSRRNNRQGGQSSSSAQANWGGRAGHETSSMPQSSSSASAARGQNGSWRGQQPGASASASAAGGRGRGWNGDRYESNQNSNWWQEQRSDWIGGYHRGSGNESGTVNGTGGGKDKRKSQGSSRGGGAQGAAKAAAKAPPRVKEEPGSNRGRPGNVHITTNSVTQDDPRRPRIDKAVAHRFIMHGVNNAQEDKKQAAQSNLAAMYLAQMLENDKEKQQQQELSTVNAEVRDKLRARGHAANAAIDIELKKKISKKMFGHCEMRLCRNISV